MFDECKQSEEDSDIRDAETITSIHGPESEENSDANSVEEEDDVIDMENYFYGKGKIYRFKWFKKLLMSSHSQTFQHNIFLKLSGICPFFQRVSLTKNNNCTYIFSTDILLMIGNI